MSSGFVKNIKKICCCISNGTDDTEQLLGNDSEYDWTNTNINRYFLNIFLKFLFNNLEMQLILIHQQVALVIYYRVINRLKHKVKLRKMH